MLESLAQPFLFLKCSRLSLDAHVFRTTSNGRCCLLFGVECDEVTQFSSATRILVRGSSMVWQQVWCVLSLPPSNLFCDYLVGQSSWTNCAIFADVCVLFPPAQGILRAGKTITLISQQPHREFPSASSKKAAMHARPVVALILVALLYATDAQISSYERLSASLLVRDGRALLSGAHDHSDEHHEVQTVSFMTLFEPGAEESPADVLFHELGVAGEALVLQDVDRLLETLK